MNDLWNDFVYAIRLLTKSPRFTVVVVLTLAIGIASNTIIFSAAHSVFLRPMSYPDVGRLVYVSQAYPGFPEGGGQFSYPTYRDILQQNNSLDALAAYQVSGPLALTSNDEPVRVAVTYCTPEYFTLLGVRTELGRVFHAGEDRVGSADPVVVLSYGFWQRQFSGAKDIVGRTIHLNDRPFTVVGVTAPEFRDSLYEQEYGEEGNAWIPLGLSYTLTGYANPADRVQGILWGIGHLKPGLSAADASADLASLANQFAKTYPDTFRGFGLVARPLKDQLLGMFYSPAWVLTAASGFLLLIGCANVGNLLLARLLSRQRELGVRAALGASPARLAAHLLVENGLLLLLASALGILLAFWGMGGLRSWAAAHLPTVIHLEAGRAAILASIAISLFTGLLFGVGPAILGSRVDLRDALSQGGRQGQSLGRRKSQKVLVVAEVALALVLLAAAGLMLESFRKLTTMDLGFKTANLLTLRLDLRSERYTEPAARARFSRSLVETLQPIPGVESVLLWGPSMLGRATWVYIAYPEGSSPDDTDARLMMGRHSVNPGALKNLGIPLLEGREITWQDTLDTPFVAVVSESVAKKLWPGQDALGKRMRSVNGNFPWITVVGVARDAHHAQRMDLNDAAAGIRPLGLGPQYDVYFPYPQRPNQGMTLAVRTSADVGSVSKALRAAVLSLDPTLPVYDLALLDERLAAQVAPVRTMAFLSGAYAFLALFLAGFGLFAVLAHDVGQRTQEIGIRMALGALPRAVLALVLREGLLLTLLGLAGGIVGAVLITRTMRALLFGVSPTEPIVFGAIAALLLVVAVLACWVPARRAMRLDPIDALRQD
ncbi:MAG TPA: ABC transporter permease [Candidatus Methylomirabilis sp.]|nr:ABC transporter permease [Candidatus Methylomirabilis sp.]